MEVLAGVAVVVVGVVALLGVVGKISCCTKKVKELEKKLKDK